jgi:hypothetical protein
MKPGSSDPASAPLGATSPAFRILHGLADAPASAWNRLAGPQPMLCHAFLSLLEETGCVGKGTGWEPCHVTLWHGDELSAAMPLYLKRHSWGEYVFDWAWADAYRRHRLAYYPKLVSAIPFTPVTGPRLLAEDDSLRRLLIEAALRLTKEMKASSLHVLFPSDTESGVCAQADLLCRTGLQFHWRNADYGDFNAFLAALDHRHRKNIRQERRKLRDAGIAFSWLSGREATEADWSFFHRCYRDTYYRHGSTPYLNLDFFLRLAEAIPDNILLIMARREGKRLAAALNLMDGERLYGRYWGMAEYVPGLHFETCYYQAMEYAIAQGLKVFEGGAQGGHKLPRGMAAVPTQSFHWLAHPEFFRAVRDYLQDEAQAVNEQIAEMNAAGPFRKGK